MNRFSKRICVGALTLLGLPALWAARGTTSEVSANAITNSSYGPLSQNSGPFTIAFWFRSGNLNQVQSYVLEGGQGNSQWAVIYGYLPGKIEFFVSGNSAVRQNTSITITDANWHHVAYRRSAAGSSSWDLFLDGVKTNISPSISFGLPTTIDFFAFNADNHANPCVCSLGDAVVYDSARPDAEIQGLAAGNHPTLSPSPLLYWPLLGTSSPEPDASGNNHPGTIQGSVVQVPDPPYNSGSAVSISVSPQSASLSAGQTQQFTSTVTGSSNTAVTWSLSPTVGTVTANGLYTAPASISSSQTVTLTVTSSADPSKSAPATITLNPVAVSVSPPSASLSAGQTQQFTSTVTGSSNTAVTWSLAPNVGTVTGNGLYTAPTSIGSSQTVTLTATSAADSTKSAAATITLTQSTVVSTARGTASASTTNTMKNASYGPLSGYSGPFTIAFWFKSGNVSQTQSYLVEGGQGNSQWAVIYGFASAQIEFFLFGNNAVRQNTGISIGDTNWHHIAYRRSASGSSSWDKFLDGVKTNINASISFSLPPTSAFAAFNSDNSQNPCVCGIADLVVYDSARPDAEVQGLATGNRPTLSPNPLLYWPLPGTSNPEQDASGNNHPGTIQGNIIQIPGPPYDGGGQTQVAISVSPTSASLGAGQTQQFSSTVTGSSNTAVTWSLSPNTGTVTSSGLYTAPASIDSAQTVTLTATSVADSTKSASAAVSLTTTVTSAQPQSGSGSVARGATSSSNSNVIQNTAYGPLSGSSGPFTIAFWFQSNNVNPTPSYVAQGSGSGQWAVIYGFTPQQIEFFTGDPNVKLNTGMAITDTNWHHIAFRKNASGSSSWDKFLDGAKTTINSSIAFSLPAVTSFLALNSSSSQNPCQCSIGDVAIYDTSRPDTEIQGLAAGNRPTLKPSPLLYWPLSGTSSQEPDLSGGNHPGTVLGSIQNVPGPAYAPSVGRAAQPNTSGYIRNSAFGPLSSSNGPFTVAFWFQSLNTSPSPSYVIQGYSGGTAQWAVIYGYTSQQLEFFTGAAAPRTNSGITITNGQWHHIAYRKNASGSSSWDKFLDGVKTNINGSINFSLPQVSSFYAFIAASGQNPCRCGLADIALYSSALADTDIQSLAQGARPLSLTASPVLYWPLKGTALESDDSGNNHPGTVVGTLSSVSPPPYAGSVSLTPTVATLGPSASQQFTATVSGGNSSVSWFLSPAIGTIDAFGNYQSPANIPAPTTVSVTATSTAVPTQYASASVTVASGPVPVSPGSVLTGGYDNERTNANPNETILTPNNVNVNQFGKKFSLTVDGFVFAQPLYASASLIPALGHNVVFIATLHNTLYAFDADSGSQLWSLSLGTPRNNSDADIGAAEMGILSTPVVDPVRQTIYVVGQNPDGFRLHAIDLITHTERAGSPVLIQGSVPGTGYDNVGGVITFNASQQSQRVGLLLANNTVYIAFGSLADVDPYHGWFFGYHADTLARSLICQSPNGKESGIWMSGGAPAVDQSGNIYLITGNGDWDGNKNFGESFLKLSATLSVLDWFTPANWATLNANDADFGSSRALLLPSTSLLTGGGKDGSIWLLNQATGQMGHLQGVAGNPPVVQMIQATTSNVTSPNPTHGLFNGMAYWSNAPGGPLFYLQPPNDFAKAYRFSNGTFNPTPFAQTTVTRPYPGAALAVSSSGSAGGILWSVTPDTATNGGSLSTAVFRAYDAVTLTELWNSTQNAARDVLGTFAKYATPTVVNGKVYVPTFSNKVVVYGPLP